MATGHRTVERIAAILELAARSPEGIRLAPVAHALNAPKSSVHGLIGGLLTVGYLVERNGAYVIGPGIGALLAPTREARVEDIARAPLERLRDRVGETVLLGKRIGQTVVYVLQLESQQLVKYSAPLRSRRPLGSTSMGRVFLADLDDRVLARTAKAVTEREGLELGDLLATVKEVRGRGLAYNLEETVPGVAAVAAGVRNGSEKVVAAISVTGPSGRICSQLERLGDAVVETAHEISHLLGSRRTHAQD